MCTSRKDNSPATETSPEFQSNFQITDEDIAESLAAFTADEHPMGSAQQTVVQNHISGFLAGFGLTTQLQSFTATTPNPEALEENSMAPLTVDIDGANIVSKLSVNDAENCTILLGSHYDTKPLDGIKYLGANDSGSSSILLLFLAKYLKQALDDQQLTLNCHITFIWFDGEEAQLHNWTDGEFLHPAKMKDNTYGSRHFVDQLTSCGEAKCLPDTYGSHEVKELILIDMVGEENIRFSRDSNSSPELISRLESSLANINRGSTLSPYAKSIEDDHIPFLGAGIPAIDVIDFENTQNWHRHSDQPENIRASSMQLAGQAVLGLIVTSN